MNTLFGDDGFQLALVYSAGLTVIALVLAHSVRVRVGFATGAVVATLLAFREQYRLPDRLVIGVVLLAVAGACAWVIRPTFLRCLAAIPGATLVALSLVGVPRWVKGVVFVAIVVGAPLLAASTTRRAAGRAAVVPGDRRRRLRLCPRHRVRTDPRRRVPRRRVPRVRSRPRAVAAGSSAAVGVIMWDAGQEGWARPGAVIGAVACMGALLLIPVFARKVVLTNPWSAIAWMVAAVHVGLVLWCSRVAGFRHSAWVAALLVIPAYVVAAGALILLRRVRTPPRSA